MRYDYSNEVSEESDFLPSWQNCFTGKWMELFEVQDRDGSWRFESRAIEDEHQIKWLNKHRKGKSRFYMM